MEIPTWMFDQSICSKMEIADYPYCSLDSIRELLLLLNDTSSIECKMIEYENTFNKKGKDNVQLQYEGENNRHAFVRIPKPSSEDMGKSNRGTTESSVEFNEQDDNRVSETKSKKEQSS